MPVNTAAAARENIASWRAYVRGRAAISKDQLGEAANQFQIALKAAANDRTLQQRTFGLALLSGNERLARELAQQLSLAGEHGFDTRLMLLGTAIQKRNWAEAKAIRNGMSDEDQLLFALPIIDAWLALGKGDDPLAAIGTTGRNVLANSYASEHRAFLLGTLGRTEEALTEYQPLISGNSGRAIRMRLAAAAMLQHAGRKADALAILAGDAAALKKGRELVAGGKRLQTGVATPAEGVAELFARLAADVSRDRVSQIGLMIGRMATFLAPENAEGWLVTADMLANDGKLEAALDALTHIAPDDPFAEQTSSLRIALLQQLNCHAEALAIAQAAASRADADVSDWTQLGDALIAADNRPQAAMAYGKAIALAPPAEQLWQLYLLRGGVYERMGDWKQAEPDLRRAVALAPDEAVTLNYLGYALLDRDLNLDEAQRLIEKANSLRPQDGAITDSLAWVHFRRGNYQSAVELLEKAVQLQPAEPTINEHLGDAYWQVGRKLEARFSWRAAMVGADDAGVSARLRHKIDFGLENTGPESTGHAKRDAD